MLIYTPEQHRANGHTTTRDKMDNIDDLNNDITDLGSSNISWGFRGACALVQDAMSISLWDIIKKSKLKVVSI